MEISRTAATAKGPAETFTGDVWVDPITRGLPPSQLNVAAVRFTPGARSAWHSHDGGQTLYVTEGHGLVQVRGQQIVELDPGDVVFAPDGEEHWHGAMHPAVSRARRIGLVHSASTPRPPSHRPVRVACIRPSSVSPGSPGPGSFSPCCTR